MLNSILIGGRNWESFGADPFLAGETAYETILGLQQSGVQACAKHWLNNEQENSRTESTSQVNDRTQHEIYAHPFLRSVMAGVAAVMCSYSEFVMEARERPNHSSRLDQQYLRVRERQAHGRCVKAGIRIPRA